MTSFVDKIPLLTPKQFDWLVKELDNLRTSDYQRLYQIMVEGRPVIEVAAEFERTPQTLYTQLSRVVKELGRRLKDEKKQLVMVFVDKDVAKEVRALETL